jgi:hypothetical protein
MTALPRRRPLSTPHPTLDGYEKARCEVGADGRLTLTI